MGASERAISVGDLVMVVRGHECGIGYTFVVADLIPGQWEHIRCVICGHRWKPGNALLAYDGIDRWHSVDRLIRIDPPAIPETTHTETEEVA